MKPNWFSITAGGCCMAALIVASLGGCTINENGPGPGPGAQEDIVDIQGFHHIGFHDENHEWHGGYDDAQHQHHDDGRDWHR